MMIQSVDVWGPRPFQRKQPEGLQAKHYALFDWDKEFTIPPMQIYHLENCLLSEDGAIFQNSLPYEVFLPSLRVPEMRSVYTPYWRLRRIGLSLRRTLPAQPQYITILDHWGVEYYHFLIESFAKAIRLKESLPHAMLILSERFNRPFHRQSLQALGLNLDEVVFLKPKEVVQVAHLAICDFPGPPDIHRAELLQRARALLTAPYQTGSLPSARVYICRKKARWRREVNWDEVQSVLTKWNFKIVYAEDLTFQEQIQLFAQTRYLISPHGAGLTNLLFMPKGGALLELRKSTYGIDPLTQKLEDSRMCNTYYHMCLGLDLNYHFLACQSPTPLGSARFADLIIDPLELETKIVSLLNERHS